VCFVADGVGDGVGGGPGGLEIEAAGDAVDVQDFACKVEVGTVAAFEGGGVHGGEGDAAAGHELVLERRPGGDGVGVGCEVGDEAVEVVLGEFGKAFAFDFRACCDEVPQAGGEVERTEGGGEALGMAVDEFA